MLAPFPTYQIPEVTRFGQTLRARRAQVLAYWNTDGLSNGGTQGISVLKETARGSLKPQQLNFLMAAQHVSRRTRHPHPPSEPETS